MSKYDHRRDTGIIIGVIVVVFLLGGLILWMSNRAVPNTPENGGNSASSTVETTGTSSPAIIGLAQCLAAKKVTMYGAYWCPHCADQKARFGSAWQYVPYVECTQNIKECLAKGVNGYPTWIFPDGSKLEGDQPLEKLAVAASCPFPVN